MAIESVNSIEIQSSVPLERAKLGAQNGPMTKVGDSVALSSQTIKARPTTSFPRPYGGVLYPVNKVNRTI